MTTAVNPSYQAARLLLEWDCGVHTITPEVYGWANRLLEGITVRGIPLPNVIVGQNGGVELEWEFGTCGHYGVNVFIKPSDEVHVCRSDNGHGSGILIRPSTAKIISRLCDCLMVHSIAA